MPTAVRASRQTAEPTVLSPRFVLRQANARTTKIFFATKHLENEAQYENEYIQVALQEILLLKHQVVLLLP